MRLQAITFLRMPGGKGVVYKAGEEFEVPDDYKGRNLAKVLIAAKRVRKFEPAVVGSPPPPPVQKAVAPLPLPEITPEITPEPMPELEPSLMTKVMQADEEALTDETPSENGEEPEGDAPRKRGRPPIHGRYSRRDLRPEE